MLRKIRITLAILCFSLTTLLFLDFTGILHNYFGWLTRIQFYPAILALNIGIVSGLVLLTLLFGRIYCSVICPLGVFQDVISWFSARRHKNRFSFSPARTWLRYGVLALFITGSIAGFGAVAALIAPYAAYGRIAANLFAPLYLWGNNFLALVAERLNSYAFYSVDVWIKGLGTFLVAFITFAVVFFLAWRNGRTWCNTICPVGTILGTLARFSLFKPRIDKELCIQCGLCARGCKASCIDGQMGAIDTSRCVSCMNCLKNCRKGALRYTPFFKVKNVFNNEIKLKNTEEKLDEVASIKKNETLMEMLISNETKNSFEENISKDSKGEVSRRTFLSMASLVALESASLAATNDIDGGFAFIEDKAIPDRETPIVPPGAFGVAHLAHHCTGCQLCITLCPNQVLRPSKRLKSWMQPEMSYERGYCRPECTRCSSVCPSGAILPVTVAEKAAIQLGNAVWSKDRCLVNTKGIRCGVCARHCPTGAIHMASRDRDNVASPRIPVIDPERCIGCGACENLCPSRPLSAIYVEGKDRHREV